MLEPGKNSRSVSAYLFLTRICCEFLSSWQSSHAFILPFFLPVTACYLVVNKLWYIFKYFFELCLTRAVSSTLLNFTFIQIYKFLVFEEGRVIQLFVSPSFFLFFFLIFFSKYFVINTKFSKLFLPYSNFCFQFLINSNVVSFFWPGSIVTW